ncbi:MAG: BON domain-containing protein [Gemmataceae bacterium]|nr:BON domain-containing protein [Gemmataceae bacterium]
MTAAPVLLPPGPADVLSHSPLPQLRRLEVAETEAEVVITGTVGSFYLKQLAQETIRPTLGCRRLLNRVEVCSA